MITVHECFLGSAVNLLIFELYFDICKDEAYSVQEIPLYSTEKNLYYLCYIH